MEKNTLDCEETRRKYDFVKIIFFTYLHIGAVFGFYYYATVASISTANWLMVLFWLSAHGTAVGAHRLWCHRTYKAKLPLQMYLMFAQTFTFQKDIYDWVRDHRTHHKYSDTDSDPHNANRGFFYSHIGWLMLKKSEKVRSAGRTIDLSDLKSDPLVMFQRRYYWYVAPLIAFLFPAFVPWYFWNENFMVSWYICSLLRYFLTLHATCLVNSAAHYWGYKPYDKNIRAVESVFVTQFSFGEGFHNYHHCFPWDYKAAELGSYGGNSNTAFIELMAWIGQAYELKSASQMLVEKKARNTGDGTKYVWGWGDKDMEDDDLNMADIF